MTIPNYKVKAGQLVRGRTSWYGGPNDALDNDMPALQGASNKNPGIAVYNRATLGGWWRLRDPRTGKTVVVQQTDLGPNTWTGKKIDLNHTLIKQLGFDEGSYDNRVMGARYLGKRKPADAGTTRTAANKAASRTATKKVSAERRAAILAQLLNSDPTAAASGRLKGILG